MRLRNLFLLLFIASGSFAQTVSDYTPYIFPDSVPSNYFFDAEKEYLQLTSQKLDGVSHGELASFAEGLIYQHKSILENAKVYFNWNEAEDYLNTILKSLLPDSLKGKSNIHVYLAHMTEKNAFTFND